MKIENIKTKKLIPYDKNQKKHPKKQIEQVAKSIEEFGFNQPIVVDENMVIIVGHGRLEAAKLLGLEEVPVMRLNITDEQAKAYRLADNKLNESDWDMNLVIEELKELNLAGFNIELTGFNKDLLLEKENKEDDLPELTDTAISKYGDIYQLGNHILMCGDSAKKEDVEKLMRDEKVDLLLTDPPYNVDYEGGTGTGMKIMNDKMSNDKFFNFLHDFYKQAFDVMKKGAPLYIFHSSGESINFISALQKAGLLYKQVLIWVKSSMVLGRQDYQWQHEPILYGWKPGGPHMWYGAFDKTTVIDDEISDKELSSLKKNELIEMINDIRNKSNTDIIRIKKPGRSELHPTTKPIKIIQSLILNSTQIGDIVYDPFSGSGATLITCEKTDRICFAMELDPIYIDRIIKRWEEYTELKAIKLN